MMFKNSLKLFVANFSLFWKLLFYKLISIGICILLLIPVISSWAHCLEEVGFISILVEFATKTGFSSMAALFNNLFVLIDTFVKGMGVLLSYNAFALIYACVIVFVLMPMLFGLSSIPTGEGLYAYMASLTKSSFVATYISKIKTSLIYSSLRKVIALTFIFVMGTVLYFLLSLTQVGGLLQIILPTIILVFVALAVSLYLTTLCGWMPATVVFNKRPIQSFKQGFKSISRRYLKVLSCIFVIIFAVGVFAMMFTTISLIALIPLASVSILMLEMVVFFESQGMRYYVDLETIISPKKLEECDKLNKVKNII